MNPSDRFEYTFFPMIDPGVSAARWLDLLNAEGDKGWQVVTYMSERLLLMRRKLSDSYDLNGE